MQIAGKLHAELILGLAVRGAGAASSFALLWLIARVFGAEVVGLYQLGMTTVVLASLFVSLGLDILLVREIGALLRSERKGDARATYSAALRAMLPVGLMLTLGVALVSVPFSRYFLQEPRVAPFLVALAPAILFLPLRKAATALLRTTGKVLSSQMLEGVAYTTLTFIALAVAVTIGRADWKPLPAVLYSIAIAITTAVSLILAHRVVRNWPKGKAEMHAASGVPIAASPIVTQASDWIMLLAITTFAGIADAGVYRTAFQICMLFQLVNASFGMMAGPHLAKAAADRDPRSVRKIVYVSGLLGLALSLPLTILCLAAPEWLLGLFGDEFRRGAMALQILVVAQVVNVGFGPVGIALIMMRRERLVLYVELVASIIGIAVAFATIETLGLSGAALGVLFSSAVRNIGNFIAARIVGKTLPATG